MRTTTAILRQSRLPSSLKAWLRSDLMALREERNTQVVFYGAKKAALSEEASAAAQRLFHFAGQLLPAGADSLFGYKGATKFHNQMTKLS